MVHTLEKSPLACLLCNPNAPKMAQLGTLCPPDPLNSHRSQKTTSPRLAFVIHRDRVHGLSDVFWFIFVPMICLPSPNQKWEKNGKVSTPFSDALQTFFLIKYGVGDRGCSPFRRCRAALAASLACYPGCCRSRRPPPSWCFLKIALKNDALAYILEHFCILTLEDFHFGKNEFSVKSLILVVFRRSLVILGGQKLVKKNQRNWTKKT